MKHFDLTESEIKKYRSLEKKKYRSQHSLYIIEGKRLVGEALNSGVDIESILISVSFLNDPENQPFLSDAGNRSEFRIISDLDAKKISNLTSPPGILALVPINDNVLDILALSGNGIYLDRIANPGNLGTLLRTAAWFGVKNVFLSPESTDLYNPKVIQGAMGAHFYLNISSNVTLDALTETKTTIIGATMSGESIDSAVNIPSPWILVLGNEASGLSIENESLLTIKLSIPRRGEGESLNVSVAGGILLSHLVFPKS